MPDLVYVANFLAYTITELNVLSESETHYNTYNPKTDKYQSWDKSSVHLTKEGAVSEIELRHSLKISDLQNTIKAAEIKLQNFKKKYNV